MLYRILILLFFVQFSIAQNTSNSYKLCVALQTNNFLNDKEAQRAVDRIMSVTGLVERPILQACDNINNAVAISYRGERYILYDPDFMKMISKNTDDYWSNLFVLAHEVGHHINGHSLDILLFVNGEIDVKSLEEKRMQELQADEFAGFVLAKLGATLQDATNLFKNFPRIPNENYSTHPNKEKRIEAVKRGYEKTGLGYSDTEILNYSLTEKLDMNDTQLWDNVIENVKDNMLEDIIDPFKRIDIIKNENIPDKKNTSWVTGKILENNNSNFLNPTLFVVQEKYDEAEDNLLLNTDLYFHNSFFIQYVLNKIPRTFHKTALSYIRNGRFEFQFIFDDGHTGLFSSISSDNQNQWGMVLKRNTNESKGDYNRRYAIFFEKLKKQKQLFIRISKIDYGFVNGIEEFIDMSSLEGQIKTHQFGLAGSSNALEF